jgi:hypothetical protein
MDTSAMLRARCSGFLFAVSLLALACDRGAPTPDAAPDAAPKTKGAAEPATAGAPIVEAPVESPPRDVTPSGETREVVVDGLKMSVPIEWVQAPGASAMRKAEFTLPGPGGDATLLVYRFAGGAGSAEQNIERWRGQVELAVGTAPGTIALEANGLKVSGVDLRGHYAGQSMPGAPPQPPIEGARLLAVSIEGSGDPYYFKLVGPSRTVDLWSTAWAELLAKLAAA